MFIRARTSHERKRVLFLYLFRYTHNANPPNPTPTQRQPNPTPCPTVSQPGRDEGSLEDLAEGADRFGATRVQGGGDVAEAQTRPRPPGDVHHDGGAAPAGLHRRLEHVALQAALDHHRRGAAQGAVHALRGIEGGDEDPGEAAGFDRAAKKRRLRLDLMKETILIS